MRMSNANKHTGAIVIVMVILTDFSYLLLFEFFSEILIPLFAKYRGQLRKIFSINPKSKSHLLPYWLLVSSIIQRQLHGPNEKSDGSQLKQPHPAVRHLAKSSSWVNRRTGALGFGSVTIDRRYSLPCF